MSRFDVLAIGNALVDVLSFAGDDFVARTGVEPGAMTMVDAARSDEIYAEMGPATETSGGSAANTASGVASFGGRARLTAGLFRSTRPHIRFEFGKAGIAWREVGTRRTLLARNPNDPGMVATRSVLERSMEAFASGGAPPASAEDGRAVLEVIAACYMSAATGSRIRLDQVDAPELASMRMGAQPGG